MKKPTWKFLPWYLGLGWFFTTVLFLSYHILRGMNPSAKAWFDAAALDSNAISAYCAALAFVGFGINSVFLAKCIEATERALDVEKKKNLRLQHDSIWLTVQIARMYSFPEGDQNRGNTRKEIEEHFVRLSNEIGEELRRAYLGAITVAANYHISRYRMTHASL